MRRVKGADTAPEIKLRKALFAAGLRFRLHRSDLPGKPDIVLPRRHIAVFVDGDMWHGNQWRLRGAQCLEEQFHSCKNKSYWVTKIHRNIERDVRATAELQSRGWRVIRVWESDMKTRLLACVEAIRNAESVTNAATVILARRTVAEYFAGIGLMRLGLEGEGWNTVFAHDIDPKKLEMYSKQFADADRVFRIGDVHELPADDVPNVTLATASFPCNDLSLAGGRDGLRGRHSSAFWGFHRILEEKGAERPPLVLLENVPGLLSSHKGEDLEKILRALNALGYAVDLLLLDAASFVPQSRRRLFVIGKQDSVIGGEAETRPAAFEHPVRPKDVVSFILNHPGIHWSLESLPAPPAMTKQRLQNILENLAEDDASWWSVERVQYLYNQMSPRHQAVVDEAMAEETPTFLTAFRRVRVGRSMAEVRNDGVAGCLRTPRGGSGREILIEAGAGRLRVRLLSPRECAALMGAPDYPLDGVSLNQALFGFGDAVCVPAVAWLARNYLTPIISRALHIQAQDGQGESTEACVA